ncbi:MAG: choice-of-anchor tandem repeat GloVer-containing protein [Candidatus Cybelea sp.]
MAFSLTAGGNEQSLYTFQGGSDGAYPNGLTALDGALYGTTQQGGGGSGCSAGCGIVFELTASGGESVLYSFQGGTDGANPAAPLVAADSVLYGTTSNGGTSKDGTVFSIAP